jgi:hypothetical protein
MEEAAMTTIRSAAQEAAARAIGSRTEDLFRESGALREGHFLLKSGKHSERYLEKFLVLQDPGATSELCGFWAARHRNPDGTPMVDVVAGQRRAASSSPSRRLASWAFGQSSPRK